MMSERFTAQWDAIDPFDMGFPHLWVKIEHLGRYLFAADLLAERRARAVADIACGTGYGLVELARVCEQVTGVDSAATSIEKARERTNELPARILHHTVGSAPLTQLVEPASMDAIVSFETIEHVHDAEQLVGEFAEILKPGGTLVVSVPNAMFERVANDGLLYNRQHKRSYSYSSLVRLLDRAGLRTEQWLGQAMVNDVARREARLIRRSVVHGRIGDCAELHTAPLLRRLSHVFGYPTQRDVERSYSMTVVATTRE